MTVSKIDSPAGYIPPTALVFGASGETPRFVDAQTPLPVTLLPSDVAAAALEGSLSGSQIVGPFIPVANRPLRVTLSGTWQGQASVLRSTDGGATRLPLTIAGSPWGVFTANANEIVAEEWESGANYYLEFAHASGTLSYRMAQ